MTKIAILSSHNGSGFDAIYNAVASKKLHLEIALVISNNTDAAVLEKAKSRGISNYLINAKQVTHPDAKIFKLLQKYDVEYIFLSGYMKKIPLQIIQNFKVINSHPSLLPKYGGAGMYGRYVHEAVIANNESRSGATLHFVEEVYDSGKIILQKDIKLAEDETVDSLESKIKILEADVIVAGLQLCLN